VGISTRIGWPLSSMSGFAPGNRGIPINAPAARLAGETLIRDAHPHMVNGITAETSNAHRHHTVRQ
ncbi:MAG: hypothetical protein KGK12_01875, partial [Armatimonadetes bacterium]|nr:hypothetical protein [Armatimonadota bacterium]